MAAGLDWWRCECCRCKAAANTCDVTYETLIHSQRRLGGIAKCSEKPSRCSVLRCKGCRKDGVDLSVDVGGGRKDGGLGAGLYTSTRRRRRAGGSSGSSR